MSTTFQVRSWFHPNMRLRNALKVASLGSDSCALTEALVFAFGFDELDGVCCALEQRLAKATLAVISTAVQRFMGSLSCLNKMHKQNVQIKCAKVKLHLRLGGDGI